MLRSLKELHGYHILALDGEVGSVHDFYFDDEEWMVRYLVVDTGPWILGRKVLLSPLSLGQPDWMAQKLPVNLTKTQIKESPDINTEKPVSRQQQKALHEYFEWPSYWVSPMASSAASRAILHSEIEAIREKEKVQEEKAESFDTHLRRTREVIGYLAAGRDGELGRVHDFILDDETWDLRYLVLDTGIIIPDKKVLIAPFWIKGIHYDDREVYIDLKEQVIKDSPDFDPAQPIQRAYEEVLYDYYGRPYYWVKR